ncbi:MAG: tRNA (N(6)-L-threonylcarbamoyladenosine(37)-C(2))-methylthiotransferase MtaB [Lachnospiraceae bacterium]|nr:tRNA (N(6)-L-threonylcarbamoyladenosine(37)-C(2))-methylthiotransferase MtaB [Lachnospiraceae bacterium]
MKKVALHNLGCKVNSYEIDVMQQMLQKNGYQIVEFEQKADIYIVNTCSVTSIADRKSRQMLHKAKKNNPDSIVVAVGCYVQTGTEDILKDEGIDLAIGNNKKKDLVNILEQFLREKGMHTEDKTLHDTTIIDINHTKEYEEMTLEQTAEHTRAYIKIQDGCNQFCTYCIIPYARGRVRSRKKEDIISEIKGLVKRGYKEVVLTGIHISSYGTDFGQAGLLDLVRSIQEIEGLQRIRLGSLEPRIVTEVFAAGLSKLSKVCPHFHLSLQSGSLNTLKRMNRHYTPGEYLRGVEELRKAFINPAITTDVIVGFPGETEEEFEETREFLENIRLYEMHIFKYSIRKGTIAAKMPDQVPDQIKAKRSDILLEIEERLSREYREIYIGQEVAVLFEEEKEILGESYQIGHTSQYVKVAYKTDKNLSNQIVSGKVTKLLTNDILLMED